MIRAMRNDMIAPFFYFVFVPFADYIPVPFHSCSNYQMRFAAEAGVRRFSLDSLFGNLFRKCPSPFGRGWREAPGEGRKSTLIRPFGPPSPRGRRTRTSTSANLDTSGSVHEGLVLTRLALDHNRSS